MLAAGRARRIVLDGLARQSLLVVLLALHEALHADDVGDMEPDDLLADQPTASRNTSLANTMRRSLSRNSRWFGTPGQACESAPRYGARSPSGGGCPSLRCPGSAAWLRLHPTREALRRASSGVWDWRRSCRTSHPAFAAMRLRSDSSAAGVLPAALTISAPIWSASVSGLK